LVPLPECLPSTAFHQHIELQEIVEHHWGDEGKLLESAMEFMIDGEVEEDKFDEF